MEAMRDVALAHYETLPDEEKVKIINDFKTVEDGGVSDYVKSRTKFAATFVKKCLKTHEGYKEEGSLDFKDFISLNYILQNVIIECDGCSSLILGKAYFSCEECFCDYSNESYDLCCECYRSRKFEEHIHKKFYNNHTLHYSSRRKFADEKSKLEELKKGIELAMFKFSSAFTELSTSVTTDLKDYYFGSMFFIDKEVGAMPRNATELEERTRSVPRRPIDLFGAQATIDDCRVSNDKINETGVW